MRDATRKTQSDSLKKTQKTKYSGLGRQAAATAQKNSKKKKFM